MLISSMMIIIYLFCINPLHDDYNILIFFQ